MRQPLRLLAAAVVLSAAPTSWADDPATAPAEATVAPATSAPATSAPVTAAPAAAAPADAPPTYAPPRGYGPPPPYPPPPGYYWAPYAPGELEEPGAKRRSTAMMVTGIVFATVGATNVAAGAVMLAAAPKRCIGLLRADFGGSSGGLCETEPGFVLASGMMMGIGGALVVVGIPLWAVGAAKPKAQRADDIAASRPTLLVGPRTAAVRWSF